MSLTPTHIDRLLEHIKLPANLRGNASLKLLTSLIRLFSQRVPFESLSLHYSPHRRVSIDLDDIFEKVVVKGRGGYCMELNALFAALLRGLGFTVITVTGRVKAGKPQYSGVTHMCNIVLVDNKRYLADVGFGAPAAFQAVLLDKDADLAGFPVLGSRNGRLEYRNIDVHTDPSQRVWVYSTQEDASAEWNEQYAFSEHEMASNDFEVMNYFTSTHPKSFFTQNVVATRILCVDPEGLQTPSGQVILFKDDFKLSKVGEETIITKLHSEEERVRALETHFDIKLSEKEIAAITGYASALK